jgi:hypothetical protein
VLYETASKKGVMSHVIEPAASGRAKCRGCGRKIGKGELRLGERQPNPYADEGDMTLWFHLLCGAYKRPEPLLEALASTTEAVERVEWLKSEAGRGIEHRRLPRIDGAQRAPTGRASCRSCRERIDKAAWRIPLVFYDQGRFEPSGFIHVECAADYFGTGEVLDRLVHFSPDASPDDRAALERALRGSTTS